MRLKRKRKEQYEQQQEREQKLERMETEIAQWKNDVCVKEMDIKKVCSLLFIYRLETFIVYLVWLDIIKTGNFKSLLFTS